MMDVLKRSRELLLTVLFVLSCGPGDTKRNGSRVADIGPEASNVDHEVILNEQGTGVTYSRHQSLTADEVTARVPLPNDIPMPPPLPPPPVMDQALQDRMAIASPSELLDVMVGVKEPSRLPRLPELDPTEPRDSVGNSAIMAARSAILDAARNERLASQVPTVQAIQAMGGEVVAQQFLGNSVTARLSAGAIATLAVRPDVYSIGLRYPQSSGLAACIVGGMCEPCGDSTCLVQDGSAVSVARSRINSDVYFNAGYTGSQWYIGIIDSGIFNGHSLLYQTPTYYSGFVRDCHNGDNFCLPISGAPWDPWDHYACSRYGHGTASAAIIGGGSNCGSGARGVSNAIVDSWKVTYGGGCGTLDLLAVQRAFSAAIAAVDTIIEAPLSAGAGYWGWNDPVSEAANTAYDMGAVVVASNGNGGTGDCTNFRTGGTVRTPAAAKKVLGIGDYDAGTLTLVCDQSNGNTSDGRIKPDFQTPTNTVTASTGGDFLCDAVEPFPATSGAGPYSAGAAAVLKSLFQSRGLGTSPGQIYAALLAFGELSSEDNNYIRGAGSMKLGAVSSGRFLTGWRSVSQGQTVEINLCVASDTSDSNLKVAIWWPEASSETHNFMYLSVLDPSNQWIAGASHAYSVWQRTQVNGSLAAGTWKIRIQGLTVSSGTKTVYFMAYDTATAFCGCIGCG